MEFNILDENQNVVGILTKLKKPEKGKNLSSGSFETVYRYVFRQEIRFLDCNLKLHCIDSDKVYQTLDDFINEIPTNWYIEHKK